jgi:heme/copper-type cytochrome/quinol oxidase subunit 2
MITGPFLDLTFLCLAIMIAGATAVLFIFAILTYSHVKYKRATSKNIKK